MGHFSKHTDEVTDKFVIYEDDECVYILPEGSERMPLEDIDCTPRSVNQYSIITINKETKTVTKSRHF